MVIASLQPDSSFILPPSSFSVLALAVLLDCFIGEYPNWLHPVVWIGQAIKLLARLRETSNSRSLQFLFGLFLVLVVCGVTGGLSVLAMWLVKDSYFAEIVCGAFLLKSSFALRALGRAGNRVAEPLRKNGIAAAREALRSLCSRDPSELNADELLAGTVESLAENASDSFVAPLFYFLIVAIPGSLIFAIPAAMVYRAINTMDAMIGYRGKFEWLGKSAARLDDLVNWIPARLTALLLLLGGWLAGANVRDGWRILRRDARNTASPNAGRPMAAMAGLLGVRLEKRGAYVLGDARKGLSPETVRLAWRIVVWSAGLMLAAAFTLLAPLAA